MGVRNIVPDALDAALPAMQEKLRCPPQPAPSLLLPQDLPCRRLRHGCRAQPPRCCGAGSTRDGAVAGIGSRCGWSGPTPSSLPCGTPVRGRWGAAGTAGVGESARQPAPHDPLPRPCNSGPPQHSSTAAQHLELCGVVWVVHGHVATLTQVRKRFPEGLVAALQPGGGRGRMQEVGSGGRLQGSNLPASDHAARGCCTPPHISARASGVRGWTGRGGSRQHKRRAQHL